MITFLRQSTSIATAQPASEIAASSPVEFYYKRFLAFHERFVKKEHFFQKGTNPLIIAPNTEGKGVLSNIWIKGVATQNDIWNLVIKVHEASQNAQSFSAELTNLRSQLSGYFKSEASPEDTELILDAVFFIVLAQTAYFQEKFKNTRPETWALRLKNHELDVEIEHILFSLSSDERPTIDGVNLQNLFGFPTPPQSGENITYENPTQLITSALYQAGHERALSLAGQASENPLAKDTYTASRITNFGCVAANTISTAIRLSQENYSFGQSSRWNGASLGIAATGLTISFLAPDDDTLQLIAGGVNCAYAGANATAALNGPDITTLFTTPAEGIEAAPNPPATDGHTDGGSLGEVRGRGKNPNRQ